jgi:trehalose 6-phosphate phosphatase
VVDPDRATPAPQTLDFLSDLSHCLQRVVIISGRDTDFLVSRVPLPGVLLIGNHGLEQRHLGNSQVVPEAQPYLERLERAAAALEAIPQAREPGIVIERKRATISVHFRRAVDPAASRSALQPALQEIARREQLQLEPGRMVWELRPPIEIDKGAVLRRLALELQPDGVIYVGDDRTDVTVFSMLKRLPGIRTLAVGVRSLEVPPEVFNDCDLVVDGVAGVTELLVQLRDLCA